MKKTWLLKVLGIFLPVVSIFLFTTYLQAATPTYIQLEFSDIDYDEAQYIKFKIAAYEDIKIVLYMKDNDNNTFYITYPIPAALMAPAIIHFHLCHQK